MSIKVLIFGGAGFIGNHFRNFYEQIWQPDEILSLDIKPDAGSVHCDVRDTIQLDEYSFDEETLLINLAAIHVTPGHPDHEYFEANILGARNVCEFALKKGIQRIIFTSSIAPYGASEELKKESTLPQPNTPYGISKLVAEEIHKGWAGRNELHKLLILRPGVVFGKGEGGNFTRLAAMIKKGRFVYPGRKDTIKGNIYVKELVLQAVHLMNSQQTSVGLYNFAYYPALTIQQIAEKVADVTGNKRPKIVLSARLLKFAAGIMKSFGLSKLGIHPDRVKKLMTSTNIDGSKLHNEGKEYTYDFDGAIKDWFLDCESGDLK